MSWRSEKPQLYVFHYSVNKTKTVGVGIRVPLKVGKVLQLRRFLKATLYLGRWTALCVRYRRVGISSLSHWELRFLSMNIQMRGRILGCSML
jgi:hypothetical protein